MARVAFGAFVTERVVDAFGSPAYVSDVLPFVWSIASGEVASEAEVRKRIDAYAAEARAVFPDEDEQGDELEMPEFEYWLTVAASSAMRAFFQPDAARNAAAHAMSALMARSSTGVEWDGSLQPLPVEARREFENHLAALDALRSYGDLAVPRGELLEAVAKRMAFGPDGKADPPGSQPLP